MEINIIQICHKSIVFVQSQFSCGISQFNSQRIMEPKNLIKIDFRKKQNRLLVLISFKSCLNIFELLIEKQGIF